jgi:hypothetical protein
MPVFLSECGMCVETPTSYVISIIGFMLKGTSTYIKSIVVFNLT